jgi:hypothetical protein
MKRVNVKIIVPDKMLRWQIERTLLQYGGEVEEYREKAIPKDGVQVEYGFEALTEAAMNIAEGVWLFGKGFVKMLSWSVHIIFGGLKWMWTEGAGKVKARKDRKTSIFEGGK